MSESISTWRQRADLPAVDMSQLVVKAGRNFTYFRWGFPWDSHLAWYFEAVELKRQYSALFKTAIGGNLSVVQLMILKDTTVNMCIGLTLH